MNRNREALKELFETIEESLTDDELDTLIPSLLEGQAIRFVQNVDDNRTIFVDMHIKKASVI